MRNRIHIYLAIIILLLLSACGMDDRVVVERLIVLPEKQGVLERLRLAETVGVKLWGSKLQDRVITQFPLVTEEELTGLFIRWGKSKVINGDMVDKDLITSDEYVFIKVGIVHDGHLKLAGEIADYLVGLVNVELAK